MSEVDNSGPPVLAVEDFVLSGCYFCLFVVALTQVLRIHARTKLWSTKKLFHALILGNTAGRSVFFLLRAVLKRGGPQHVSPLVILFNVVPALLFFTTYFLLVSFWAEVYHKAHSQSVTAIQNMKEKTRSVYIWTNVAIYGSFLVLYPVTFFVDQDTSSAMFSVFLVILSAIAAGSFIVYGTRLQRTLGRQSVLTPTRQGQMRTVGAVMWICTAAFLIRIPLTIIFNLRNVERNTAVQVIGLPLGYFINEILPTVCLLWIFRKMPPSDRDASKPLMSDAAEPGQEGAEAGGGFESTANQAANIFHGVRGHRDG